jgi:hypothetical protein
VIPKRLRLAPLALLLLAVTSGCSATTKPEPTPTPAFASEEEAFAAAEETYREYIDAVNARIAGESSPSPQDFLIGLALEADIDGERFFEEQGLLTSGAGAVISFSGSEYETSGKDTTIRAFVCLDATSIRVSDAAGTDVTPADRGNIVAQNVEFIRVDSELLIAQELPTSADAC